MLSFLIGLMGIILTIFLVVGIHELGHFLIARLCGIKVLKFSLGFGKKLFGWHDKTGTEYILGAIPLGGYVKMVDESEDNVAPEDLPFAYNRQSVYKRMAVIIAGPLSNFLFALLLYWIIFLIGFTTFKPLIGSIKPGSIAASAGLKPHHEIIEVDSYPTTSWNSILLKILLRIGDTDTLQMKIKNLKTNVAETKNLNLINWEMDELKPDPIESLGIIPFVPVLPPVIGSIQKNSPAENSGLQTGDKIVAIDNIPIKQWSDILIKITPSYDETLNFKIERAGKIINIPVTIGTDHDLFFNKWGFLGIAPHNMIDSALLRHTQYGPWNALVHAWYETKDYISLNFIIFGKMLSGKISIKSLGGPITIFGSAGTALNLGILPFLNFLAFLSIAIGAINILPIPGLDGGHLLFQSIELISRKPVSMRTQLLLLRLGLILLLLLIMQAIANDLMRL